MAGKRYNEEFKIAAVKQVTEDGYSIADVAKRLGITTKSLYHWRDRYGENAHSYQEKQSNSDELRRLKAELKRVTEERRKPPCSLPPSRRKIHAHKSSPTKIFGAHALSCIRDSSQWFYAWLSNPVSKRAKEDDYLRGFYKTILARKWLCLWLSQGL